LRERKSRQFCKRHQQTKQLVFSAVYLNYLALQERPVGDIVAASVAASTAEAERASGREDEEGLM
jgi:hypothetical protein